jgi:hypothetical protein
VRNSCQKLSGNDPSPITSSRHASPPWLSQ